MLPLIVKLRSSQSDATTYNPIKRARHRRQPDALDHSVAGVPGDRGAGEVDVRGPVFFRQVRIGEKAKPFTMLKFRTMTSNADHALHQEYVTGSSSRAAAHGSRPAGVSSRSPTIHGSRPSAAFSARRASTSCRSSGTCCGETCRSSGRGRRCRTRSSSTKPWHCRRVLEAKPGITGLWQVTGAAGRRSTRWCASTSDTPGRCSLWTDIKILLATPRAVITGKGAC